MKILVVGCGSIGQRHIRNIKGISKKYEVIGFDVIRKTREKVSKELKIKVFSSFKKSLDEKPDVVFICTPPYLHIRQALETAKRKMHLFIEKPLSHNMKDIDKLIRIAKKNRLITMVAANTRYYKSLAFVKKLLQKKTIGKIYGANIFFGYYLPYWRPNIDYTKNYSAKKAMGGGVILDAIHEINYARWFFGEVKELFAFSGKKSDLKIDTEDHVDVLLRFKEVSCYLHLDYLQKTYERHCTIFGEKGKIEWDFSKNSVDIFIGNKKKTYNFKTNINDMYIEEVRFFLNSVKNRNRMEMDIENGKKDLEVALMIKKSSKKLKMIKGEVD